MPPARVAGRLTGLTLLDEEIPEFHSRGIDLHTVVYEQFGEPSETLRRHVFPRKRSLPLAAKAMWDCLLNATTDAIVSESFSDRFELARVQRFIAQTVRKNHLSIIHSHWARPNGTAASLAKLYADVPLVITLRGADVLNEPSIGYGNTLDPLFRRRIKFAFDNADRIIGVSNRIIQRAIELGADPDKSMVIPKGVDTTRFAPADRLAARNRLNLPDRPTILFVGALGPWKGIDDLLEAFLRVRTQVPEAQLVMCGQGAMQSQIESTIDQHQLEDSIFIPGHVARDIMPSYFHACDVFVLPSLTEGSGNVLLEAAACGRPTVGTSVGGIPDYIEDKRTGFLCEKRNPTELSASITALLTNPELADRMGQSGLKRTRSDFRYDQMIDRTVDVYRELVSHR